MMTYSEMLRQSGLDRVDSQALFRHVFGRDRAWLIAHDQDAVAPGQAAVFAALAARRQAGEPIAYIVGEREFFGRSFTVTNQVLIPRPETEQLVELALASAPHGGRVVDLGTGSGVIAVTLKLERPDLDVWAVDVSSTALAVAQGNARRLGAVVHFVESDWLSVLVGETFALMVSNPPYIERQDAHLQQGDLRFEPRQALTDEADGLRHIRHIVAASATHLQSGGWLLFEHGWDQGAACRQLLHEAGLAQVQTWLDLAGLERISGGRAC